MTTLRHSPSENPSRVREGIKGTVPESLPALKHAVLVQEKINLIRPTVAKLFTIDDAIRQNPKYPQNIRDPYRLDS